MVGRAQREHHKYVHDENQERRKKKGKQKKCNKPQSETNLEVALSPADAGQNWLSVSAAAEGPQRRTEAVMRMQQEVQIKESSWRQPKGEDRTEMKKVARVLRCTLLNGSTWSTEKNT